MQHLCEPGSFHVTLAGLKLSVWTRLPFCLQRSTCLCLARAEIKGVTITSRWMHFRIRFIALQYAFLCNSLNLSILLWFSNYLFIYCAILWLTDYCSFNYPTFFKWKTRFYKIFTCVFFVFFVCVFYNSVPDVSLRPTIQYILFHSCLFPLGKIKSILNHR